MSSIRDADRQLTPTRQTPDSRPTPDSRLPTPGTRELFLGIDGGQTGTQAVLVDGTGRVLGRGAAGPSNHVEMPGGRERLRAAVIDSSNGALSAAGLGRVDAVAFEAVYCAMTGEADFKTEIITPIFQSRVVRVEHDAPAALAGGTLGDPGIIVIAGTGSVVYGEDAEGRSARAGGWGYVFGDEGSGFGLAREGIRAGLEALDGVGPQTALVPVLTRRFALADLRLLPMVMYNGHVSRDGVAAAARDVLDTWQAGDGVAGRVVASGIEALASRVRSIAERLALVAPRVCLSGGVFRSGAYAEAFRVAVVSQLPGATVEPASLSPAEGAALLALRAAGRPLTDALRAALVNSSRVLPEP
ncbi:ATPase [Luteitalea sp. TBR-22]|uniref:BadF/BadG/BcrA/BcrD ATPase family protein n=1 Tax=Luteitalea sp. TBR-22 TaxID=2802971 RepID=UPI001AF09AC8|nr:BadF/BadG/BcrA/BcrD ATPase family protein [Luteitalea sp. TBR-22]BCS35400.1 ATPase [Luteitalea sp. TBR-22]